MNDDFELNRVNLLLRDVPTENRDPGRFIGNRLRHPNHNGSTDAPALKLMSLG